MTAPDGKIRIPLNEEGTGGRGQIDEYLRAYNGEGIQHIALICDDLIACIDRLRASGVPLMAPPPATYYAQLDDRLPGHGEPVEELKTRGILLDGSTEGGDPRLLLQIFAQPQIGPVFFEFIQRKKDEGFGDSTDRPRGATRACCCRFSHSRRSGRCSSNSSSARRTKASARVISPRCSRASRRISWNVGCWSRRSNPVAPDLIRGLAAFDVSLNEEA